MCISLLIIYMQSFYCALQHIENLMGSPKLLTYPTANQRNQIPWGRNPPLAHPLVQRTSSVNHRVDETAGSQVT